MVIILFAVPNINEKETYVGSINQIAEKYKQFNSIISDKFYENIPNLENLAKPMEEKDIVLGDKNIHFNVCAFKYKNPCEKNQEQTVSIVNYLFDVFVNSDKKRTYLPNLRIIQISGSKLEVQVFQETEQIYTRNGWCISRCHHSMFAQTVPKKSPITLVNEAIMDYNDLIKHAKDHGYNQDKSYFKLSL